MVPALVAVSLLTPSCRAPTTPRIRVPEDYPRIQSAIDAASDGDVIDIAPGTYVENLTLDRSVTLRARAYEPRDPRNNTAILDGGRDHVVTIPPGVTPGPSLIGLVIRNGEDGISARSPFILRSTYVQGCDDQVGSEEEAGGLIVRNVFENPGDDAIDVDHAVRDVTIAGNLILQANDDGIEIRLHDDSIPERADIVIRDNEIVGSGEDGIQLIDYSADTNRRIIIEGNMIRDVAKAGVGLMDGGNTVEDFRGASIRERIHVFHNTLVGNDHGISGGDNLIALNNVFVGHQLAVKNVDGDSIVGHNLFWSNVADDQGSVVDATTTLHSDPALDADARPTMGSPAIDAGTAHFEWAGEVVMDQPPSAYRGAAPDLGWYEAA